MSPGSGAGAADARLAGALCTWRQNPSPAATAQVYAALVDARVFAAISATRTPESPPPAGSAAPGARRSGTTELALLTLLGSAGDRALPLFLDAADAVAFRTLARPLPLAAPDACAAALQDGAVAVLLDPRRAAFAVSGTELCDLAAGRAPIAGSSLSFRRTTDPLREPGEGEGPQAALVGALADALRPEPVRAARLLRGPDGPVLGLVPQHPLDAAQLAALVARVLPRLAAVLPAEGLDVAVVPAEGPGRPVPLDEPATRPAGPGRLRKVVGRRRTTRGT